MDQTYHSLMQITNFETFDNQIITQKKTHGQGWTPGSLSYNLGFIHLRVGFQVNQDIVSFDYTAVTNAYIDFSQVEQNCQIIWDRVLIWNVAIDANNYYDIISEKELVGYYYFYFLHKNRQFVENLVQPTNKFIYIEEKFIVMNKYFIQYQTNNIFSAMKINFPNFWRSLAYFNLKIGMRFTIVFATNIDTQVTTANLIHQLYQREFYYTTLGQSSTIQNQIQTSFTYHKTSDFQITLIQKILLDGSVITSNNMAIIFQHGVFEKIPFTYIAQLSASYAASVNNFFRFNINDLELNYQSDKQRFSDRDKHFCAFNFQQDFNPFFFIIFQEIIFYQGSQTTNDNTFIDSSQQVTFQIANNNTFPFVQERFMINNNDYLVFSNQKILNLNQKCDSLRYCQRCIDFKCILCNNDYYLENGTCVKCFHPFMIVDGLCVLPTTMYKSLLVTDPRNFLTDCFNNMQVALYEQSYIQILVHDNNNYLIEKLQYTLVNEYVNNVLTFKGQILAQALQDFYARQVLIYQRQIQFQLFEINTAPQSSNITRTFKCPKYYFADDQDRIECVDICPEQTYLKDFACYENDMGCLTQNQIQDNQCQTCNTGFMQISYQQSSNCVIVDGSLMPQEIDYGHRGFISAYYASNYYTFQTLNYELCDPQIDSFLDLPNLTCAIKNDVQGNNCTELLLDGLCNFASPTNVITNGFRKDNTNTLFYYFKQNYFAFFENTCHTDVTFNGIVENITRVDNLCVWNSDLNSNNEIKKCLFYDENCSDCSLQDVHLCSQCSTGTLLDLDFTKVCTDPIPGCLSYIYYRGELQCQICDTAYSIVSILNVERIYGICVLKIITYCTEYEYINNIAECKSCEANYTLVHSVSKMCVPNSQLVTNCSKYFENTTSDYWCINCTTNYTCLDLNFAETNVDETVPVRCYGCLASSNIVSNCYFYNISLQCQQCYLNYTPSSPTLCDDNCDVYDPVITSNCQTCKTGSVLYNNSCYIENIGCLAYSQVSCITCDTSYRLFYVEAQKMNLCYDEIPNCEIYSETNYYNCTTCQSSTRYYSYTGTYDACGLTITNCQQYSAVNHLLCDVCTPPFRKFQTPQDYDQCVNQIQFCDTYSTVDLYICDNCQVGYRIFETLNTYDQCVQEILNCETYSTTDNKVCDQCQVGFRIFQTLNDFDQCVQEIPNCTTYSTSDKFKCDTCDIYYRIFLTGNYDMCAEEIVNCDTYSTTNFKACDNCVATDRKFLTPGDYDQCHIIINYCQNYSTSDSLKCDTCDTNYRIYVTTTYDRCDPVILNCTTYSTTDYYICDACNTGYRQYLTAAYNECWQEINQCLTYSTTSYHVCDACNTGYRQFSTPTFDQCEQVIDQCQTYSTSDQLKCDACNTGYRIYAQPGYLDICAEEIINCSAYSTIDQFDCDNCDVNYRVFLTNTYNICEQVINQCQTYSIADQLKCDTCNINYRLFQVTNDFDICGQVIDFCDTYSTSDIHVCQTCQTGYRQYDTLDYQQCWLDIQDCQIYSTTNYKTCDQCITGYRIFLKSGDYDLCKQEIQNCDKYDLNDFYVCTQCIATYRVFDTNEYDICELEITQCLVHSTIDQLKCDSCQINYRIFETINQLDQCILEIVNCLNYSTTNYYNCDQCNQGYRVFITNGFDICEPEIIQCQQYSKIDRFKCDVCQNGYRVFSIANDYDKCIQEINNCQNYSTLDHLVCDNCIINYRLFDTTDFDQCWPDIQQCDQYSIQNYMKCDNCLTNFRIFQTTSYDICASEIDLCTTYSKIDQYICDQCQQNYRAFSFQNDYDKCIQVIDNCLSYSQQNLLLCDNCITNYRVFNTTDFDQCWPIIVQCQQYSTNNYLNCQTCNSGYRIYQNLNSFDECFQIIDNCQEYSLTNHFKCQTCQTNYRAFGTQNYDLCIVQIQLCNVYSTLNYYKCDRCQIGYRAFSITNSFDICIQQIPQCNKYSISNQQDCDSCLIGYRLYKVSSDFDKCPQVIANCKQYSSSDEYLCDTCNDGYIKSNNSQSKYNECILLIENCKVFSNFKCIECNEGYTLLEDKGLCMQTLDQEVQQNSVVQFAVPIQNCLLSINNCSLCNGEECAECIEGYILVQNQCKQECLVTTNNCTQCQDEDPQKCKICQEGLILINQQCINICLEDVPGYVCPEKLCLLQDQNCLQCNTSITEQCLECRQNYDLNEFYYCIKQKNLRLRQIEQIDLKLQCSYLCTKCEEGVCKECVQNTKLENGNCIDIKQDEEVKKDIEEKQQLCTGDDFCFKQKTYFLSHCQKCKQRCKIDLEKSFSLLKLRSSHKLYFSTTLVPNSDITYTFYTDQTGMLDIKIINLDLQSLTLQFSGEQLIDRSRDCIPQKIYQFSIQSDFQGVKAVKNAKSAGTAGALGGFFNFSSLFLPRWIFGFFLGSLQTLDVISYFSFNNLNGGSLYNLLNTFPEEKISIIQVNVQTHRDYYEKEFKQAQYQIEFFNILDQDSVYLIVGFVLTQLFMILKVIFKQRKQGFKNIYQTIKQELNVQIIMFFDSLVAIMTLYIISKTARFFLVQQNLTSQTKLMLFFIDCFVSYFAFSRMVKYYDFLKFNNKKNQKIFGIFQDEPGNFQKYEILFNFFIAVEIIASIVKMKIYFMFQTNHLFSNIVANFVGLMQCTLYMKFLKQHAKYMKYMFMNQIASEILYITYTFIIYANHIQKSQMNWQLNTMYVILNILKFGEGFTTAYAIKQIKVQKLKKMQLENQDTFLNTNQDDMSNSNQNQFLKKEDKQQEIKRNKSESLRDISSINLSNQ